MREDENFRQIVRASTRRILELKLTYLRGPTSIPYIPDISRVQNELPDPNATAFFLDLAARSATIVKPAIPNTVFPLRREEIGRVLLAGRFPDFFTFGRTAFPDASVFRYSNAANPEALAAAARNADTVIFCLSDQIDLRMLQSLQQLGKRVIVLSILSPVHIESVPWVTGAVAVYSYAPESFAAGFSAITGRIPAQGILPYEL